MTTDIAKTPRTGWNSRDRSGPGEAEDEGLGKAHAMAAHLKQAGREYVMVEVQEITGEGTIRDLWSHQERGAAEQRVVEPAAPHGARLFSRSPVAGPGHRI